MVPEARRLVLTSPIALLKACKNPAELAGMRACHLRDGAAVVEFLAWLDAHFLGSAEQKGLALDEVSLADKLLSFRAQQAGFLEPSFDTIAGVNENGAIIHYRYHPYCISALHTLVNFSTAGGGMCVCMYVCMYVCVCVCMCAEPRRDSVRRLLRGTCCCWTLEGSTLMAPQVRHSSTILLYNIYIYIYIVYTVLVNLISLRSVRCNSHTSYGSAHPAPGMYTHPLFITITTASC